jgi:hypothetical protein
MTAYLASGDAEDLLINPTPWTQTRQSLPYTAAGTAKQHGISMTKKNIGELSRWFTGRVA